MEIMKTIANPIGELAIWLEETYQVNACETIEKWHELTGMKITVEEGEVSHDEVQSLDVNLANNPKSNKKIPKIKNKDVCWHVFSSGQRAGEQCTTKPKGGAQYCSAHRPKDSAKSTKKTPKKKEVKKIDKIESDFDSDSEDDRPIVKKEPKKIKEKVVPKKQKKVSGDTDMSEDSDGELVPRELLAEKRERAKIEAAQAKKTIEDSDEALSEPETPTKPLLKKKVKKAPAKPLKQKHYDTDEEVLDKDLDLGSDNE